MYSSSVVPPLITEILKLRAERAKRDPTRDQQRMLELVPFVQALVPVVDVDAGNVRLADVAGLLEDDE